MQEKNNFFYKLSSFILNYKPMFIILFVCLSIGSIFTLDKATIESDLSNYLEPTSLTRKGLVVFEEEFAQLVSADLMLKNISYDDSLVAYNQISQTDGVLQVTFDETKYKEDNALYKINFDSEFSENSDIVEILTNINEDITNNFSDTQVIINSSVYNNDEEDLNAEMTMILGLAVIIISLILVFTSKSFAEIPILLCVFGVAALINKGTNFVFYDISFISDSIGVILQLALAIDYALILLHRYTEERELNDPNEACKIALSKAIPEISASSLTTVCGLIALSYMTYRLGFDMSKVLIKSIFISLFCVFTLLPSLLVIFDKAIQKTTHKNFVPSIANLCNASLKSTKIVLPLFLIVTALAYTYADKAEYFFYEGTSDLDTESPSYQINSVFGQSNDLAIIVPSRSSTLIDKFAVDLYKLPQVDSITSFSTIEIAEGVTLDTPINYMQATQLVGVDAETAYMIFANFAGSIGEAEDYVNISDTYTIPVIDLIYFLYNMKDSGAVPEELIPNIVEQVTMIDTLKDSLTTENFHMILVSLNTTVESEQTFDFLHKLSPIASRYFYQYYLVGECVSSYELSNAFQEDKLTVSKMSIMFIAAILILTFKSIAICFSMIFAIQSAIFINFAVPYFQGESLFFIGYLIVVAIQMGANIDYAIVITNRYKQLKTTMDGREAIIKATDMGFTTVITSGSILSIAGLILQQVSTDVVISSLGGCIARGTLISMLIVIFILPQFLYLEHLFSSYEPATYED